MVARKFANLLQPDGLDAANPTHELGQDLRGALPQVLTRTRRQDHSPDHYFSIAGNLLPSTI